MKVNFQTTYWCSIASRLAICGGIKVKKNRSALFGYLFVGLSMAGLLWFYVIPFLGSFFQVLVNVEDGFSWKGIKLYKDLMLYSTFGQAFQNTLLMLVVSIPILLIFTMILSFFMDKMMENKVKGSSFWYAVHLLPMILPSAVITSVIKIIFSDYGLLNSILTKCGFEMVPWLDSYWSFWILCFIFLWKNTGYSMVVLFSGMKGIEKQQREAASLDGASDIKIFFYIIIPQLWVFIRFIIVMGIIGVFKTYRESYLIFGDMPPDAVYMLQNFLNNNFTSLNFDRTIAASVLVCIFIGILLALLFRFMGGEHEKNQKTKKKEEPSC